MELLVLLPKCAFLLLNCILWQGLEEKNGEENSGGGKAPGTYTKSDHPVEEKVTSPVFRNETPNFTFVLCKRHR